MVGAASEVVIELAVYIVVVVVAADVPMMELTLVAADSWAVEICLQPVRAMYH